MSAIGRNRRYANGRNGSKADIRAQVRWRLSGLAFSPTRKNTFLHPHLYALSCPMQPPRIRFTPVPLKARHDGWTPARQLRFIEHLATAKSVSRACKAVGKSTATAYALRGKPGAQSFAAAWDKALAFMPDRNGRRLPLRSARHADHRKADEMEEVHGPPVSPTPPPQASPALTALEALLERLRAHA